MITTVGNTKGGVGKTSIAYPLAVSLAARGRRVALIDTDKQGSAEDLFNARIGFFDDAGHADPYPFTLVSKHPKDPKPGEKQTPFLTILRQEIQGLKANFDEIIIDVGGRDGPSLRAALCVSDVLLCPMPPRCLDVWATLGQMEPLVEEVTGALNEELKTYAILNRADPGGSRENSEARDAINASEVFDYLDADLVNRKAIPKFLEFGLAVFEDLPGRGRDSSAVGELSYLVHKLYPQ